MDTNDRKSSPDSGPADAVGQTAAERKAVWRKQLVDKRQKLADSAWRNDLLQRVMRVWLIERSDAVIGAYWPIKGEFDPLPALFRWQEAGLEEDAQGAQRHRRISLPVVNKVDKTL
ncbi:MAG: 5-formyltetrahydrofolate cyclo-ligase, partial [Comamonadaceae bacterium]|nr:5-formyltetrahydrofolate cyclo-ligase [Comamonadaceae bacterium]